MELDLPGFRFHPTEEELLDFYLRRVVHGKKLSCDIIGTLNLYRHDPWELPGLAKIGEREWYFFVPRDRRHTSGGRPNRTTEGGFWKATGSDRPIRSAADPKRLLGLKKTLVFYRGRAPRGNRTDWVMNEYRLPDSCSSSNSPPKEDIVLCKIYQKATSLKELEQRAAREESSKLAAAGTAMLSFDSILGASGDASFSSSSDQDNCFFRNPTTTPLVEGVNKEIKKESDKEVEVEVSSLAKKGGVELELQVPKYSFDWLQQDPFLTQLRSPWLDHWSPYYANVLNL